MIGVVIGRFQVDELHEGHLELLERVQKMHRMQFVILLGCRATPATEANPLSYLMREQMLRRYFPDAIIHPILDHPSDQVWSEQIDATLDTLFPGHKATLYGGRESFVPYYHGRHTTRTLDFGDTPVSGSDVRRKIAEYPRHSADFRAGVIYALANLQPRIYLTVDIAALGPRGILLGRKRGDEKWRLPGGFVDLGDETIEAAARRELYEETALTVEGPLTYLGSHTVDDWRSRGAKDVKHLTALFAATGLTGAPTAHDDLAEVRWWSLAPAELPPIVSAHRPLIALVQQHTQGAPR